MGFNFNCCPFSLQTAEGGGAKVYRGRCQQTNRGDGRQKVYLSQEYAIQTSVCQKQWVELETTLTIHPHLF